MGDSFSIVFDHSALDAALDELEAGAQSLVRPAAQAGAQVLYDEVVVRVSAFGRNTGALAGAIYQAFSPENSSELAATYHVSWNARKAWYGRLVEYGYIRTRKVYRAKNGNWYTSKELLPTPKQIAAQPFLRPAYDTKVAAALAAAETRYADGMRELIARLS